MSGRKTRVELPLSQKLQRLQELGAGERPNSLAEKYKVDRSVVSRVKKKESKVREHAALNKNQCKKRQRKPEGENVETALYTWFKQMRGQNVPIHGPMLLEKATQFAIQ